MQQVLLTGTHVYGPVTDESDIDIVVSTGVFNELIKSLEEKGIKVYQTEAQHAYDDLNSCYFDIGPLTINLIHAQKESDMKWWKENTEKMKKIPPIEGKEERVETFCSFDFDAFSEKE